MHAQIQRVEQRIARVTGIPVHPAEDMLALARIKSMCVVAYRFTLKYTATYAWSHSHNTKHVEAPLDKEISLPSDSITRAIRAHGAFAQF